MSTYKVIEVAPDGALRAAVRELVQPAAGQVRIRVEACGICHTDTFSVQPHEAGAGDRVPGHEVVGVIDAVGAGVEGWSAGQRAGVGFLGGHCGACESCRRGNFVACTNQPWTGMTVDGGYAEVVYARATGVVAVPDELTSVEAAPLLCAGFTTFNALLRAEARAGDLVAVQGIGGLGHLGIQYAAKMGLRVAAIARGTAKEPLARKLGAHHYIDSAAADPGEALKDSAAPRSLSRPPPAATSRPCSAGCAAAGGSSSSARLTSRSPWPRCSWSSTTSASGAR